MSRRARSAVQRHPALPGIEGWRKGNVEGTMSAKESTCSAMVKGNDV